MKKYEAPEVKIASMDLITFVCGSNNRKGDWGGNDPENPYVNPDYHNEGYNSDGEKIEDDFGGIDAQSKSSSLWDDFEDE